ncbi:MAG: hypothetical protein ACJ76N_00045 [Thermoanaerobaculia bacterium]
MDLDDLKQRWEEADRKLDASLRLSTRLLRDSALGKAARATSRLSWLMLPELLLNLAAVVWLGSFLADHFAQARFAIPALALDLGAIALLIAQGYQWVALRSLDYGAPVVAIQKEIGRLRLLELRVFKWVLITAPLAWTPLLIVAIKGLTGLDAYAILSGAWLAANVAFGVAVLLMAVWISRRYAERMESSPWLQRLMRNLSGYNLTAAAGFLSSLARFEEESPA